MELTKAQFRQLRSMCNRLSPSVAIGKSGIEAVVGAANEALDKNELIKCSVKDGAGMSAREAADALAELTEAQVIQVIGHKFSIYRRSSREGIKHIEFD